MISGSGIEGESLNIVITATDKASNIIAGISKTITFMTGAVADLTGGFIEYGDQVQKLSLFIGTNSEETSRLIQVADDAFVEFETLRMAAKNLSEKGFQPNIETMAKLSDEFLKLKPGLERSQFLIDKFGRSGMEMAKVMTLGSTKIRDMNKNIEAGLIIDDQKAAKILQTKQAMDSFNDSIQATKYEVAGKLLEIFTAMPKPLQNVVLTLGAVGQSGLLNQLTQLGIIGSNIAAAGGLGGLGATLTSIGAGAKAMAVGVYAAVGPVALLAGALALLVAVIDKYGAQAWKTLQMIAMIISRPFVSDATFKAAADNMGKARGGSVSAGRPYIVGEQGPELFMPSSGGSIVPNNRLGGGQTIVINYSTMIGVDGKGRLQRELAPLIRNAMRGG